MNQPITKVKTIKSHCNTCLGEKNHLVLFKHESSWHQEISPEFDISGDDIYELLQCCGCDSICFRHKSQFSEDYDDEGRPEWKTHYYPPAISRQKPKYFKEIISVGSDTFSDLEDMIDEVYVALENGSTRLATMGIRAIIETVMIDKVSDNGTFVANLEELYGQGYVSSKQKDRLKIVLEAGHAAMHRGYCPSSKELNNILDICENLIEFLYVHEIKTDKLSKKIPPRPPKKKKGSKNTPDPTKT